MECTEENQSKFEFDETKLMRPRHIKSHLGLPLLPKQIWEVKSKVSKMYNLKTTHHDFNSNSRLCTYPGIQKT